MLSIVFLLAIGGCATIRDTGGVGTLKISGSNVFLNKQPAETGSVVHLGDELTTGKDSSALLEFTDGGFIQLDQDTDPVFSWFEQGKCLLIRIFKGQVYLKKEQACIEGPNVQLVLGSELNMQVEPRSSTITVVKGTATIEKPKPLAVLSAQQVQVSKRGFEGKVRSLSSEELREVVRWRDQYRFPLREIEPTRPMFDLMFRRHSRPRPEPEQPSGDRQPETTTPVQPPKQPDQPMIERGIERGRTIPVVPSPPPVIK
jgi:hypothetical protein